MTRQIVIFGELEIVKKRVKELSTEGWKLHGRPIFSILNNEVFCQQWMEKEE